MNIPQKMVDTFLLNSVTMASDHVINGLSSGNEQEILIDNEFVGAMFKRGLLGQLKLREEYVGGSTEEDSVEIEQYDFWN